MPLYPGILAASASVAAIDVNLYETFEFSVTNGNTYSNKFNYTVIALSATFTAPSAAQYTVQGFYDGGNTWRVRFPAIEQGNWTYTYSWSDATPGDSGGFSVGAKVIADLHGPVTTDGDRYLRNHDGTPHFLVNSAWTWPAYLGPTAKGGQTNNRFVSDADLDAELDKMVTHGLNSIWVGLWAFAIENDDISWDLTWAARIDRYVQESLAHGLYCIVQAFSTWSRDQAGGLWFETSNNDSSHPFNAWSTSTADRDKAVNYIKYAVARWGGYSTVYWNLCNEFDNTNRHTSTAIANFKTQANAHYIPAFRAADAFDRPIGTSEIAGAKDLTDLDILGVHQSENSPTGPPLPSENLPWHCSEWVRDELSPGSPPLWDDPTIRNAANRPRYRRANWRLFAWGGVGSFEASSRLFPNYTAAIDNVMADSGRLRAFIDDLATAGFDINDGDPFDGSIVTSGVGTTSGWTRRRMRRKTGEWYVVYIEASGSQSAGSLTLSLPAGTYDADFYHPSLGTYTTPASISGGTPTVSHPAFTDDIVLRVLRTGSAGGGDITIGTTGALAYQGGDQDSYTFTGVTVDGGGAALVLIACRHVAFGNDEQDMNVGPITFTLNAVTYDTLALRYSQNTGNDKFIQATIAIWNNPTAGDIVFTPTNFPGTDMTGCTMAFMNVSGLHASPVGAVSQENYAAGTSAIPFQITTTAANSLIISHMGMRNIAGDPWSWDDANMIEILDQSGGTANDGAAAVAYRIVTSIGTYNVGGDASASDNERIAGAAVELKAGAAAAGYSANPVHFDGTNDYLVRGGGLTGAADSVNVLGSFWIRRTGTGTWQTMFRDHSAGSKLVLLWRDNNKFLIQAHNAAETIVLHMETSVITGSAWHHVAFSSNGVSTHLYVDGVSDKTLITIVNSAIDFTETEWTFGRRGISGTEYLDADVADFQLWFGTYLDLSQAGNRALFFDTGLPVDPATAASTLGEPIIKLAGATDTWHTNDGTGGGFTENGALTDGQSPVAL